MVQDPFYIDFSKQPDNEIWYTTFDNKKLEKNSSLPDSVFFTGGWGKQSDLQFVKHTYESGLGKITYNKPIVRLGENAFRGNISIRLISFPKQFIQIYAYCLNYGAYMNQLSTQPIGIFNIIDNVINIHDNSVVFYRVYVKNNVTFNERYTPSVIIVR